MELLKKRKQHVLKLEGKIDEIEINEAMNWGISNEINAMTTLVTKILPLYYPNIKYTEEGCYVIEESGHALFVVSPDGGGKDMDAEEICMAFGFKCPRPGKSFTTDVHYNVNYITQLMLEMRALEVDRLL